MPEPYTGPLERLDACRWRIPRSYMPGMRVDGLIYADDVLIEHIRKDKSPQQVANVATLPGIVKYSLAMPDIHWGYGFCIGGVAATDPENGGVISPGGVGYDINCGVRLIRTNIKLDDARPRMEKLIDRLFARVPCGVGQGGRIKFNRRELAQLMELGSPFVVKRGLGWESDVECTEAHGCINTARPDYVSDHAYERGLSQCGTLGSGNHFMEVQVVDHIDDRHSAEVLGLEKGLITVMIHSGSRGLGYQVCEDSLKELQHVPRKYGIDLPDRQLVCAPVKSPEGQRYLGAMQAAANFAWCNRQIMTHLARETFAEVFEQPAEKLGMTLVYDVAHNIAKMEPYEVGSIGVSQVSGSIGVPPVSGSIGVPPVSGNIGVPPVLNQGGTGVSPVNPQATSLRPQALTLLCVHRKGATRAFPPGHPELAPRYRGIGQPVLVPGDMGRASYVLVGRPGSMEHTFGSSCHGAGRMMSRSAAIRASKGRSIARELRDRGVIARARGRTGLEEEQPDAYKDVNEVVGVLHEAGISQKVARLKPVGVIKG